ncbi:hypothetical protein [Solidesulfovibrio sp. C21]|uniref:hypothetical protein n=1 Tax=Solidesulfovibrio sp. C21 TaxID=3398613 RepID=UPI0039FD41FE
MGRFKVGVRLFVSVIVTALITVGIAVLGYQGLRQTGARVSDVAGQALPCVEGLGFVKEGILAAQSGPFHCPRHFCHPFHRAAVA